MTLLAPALLLGLLGLALPVVAHLLGREPPRPIRFAAMRFLTATDQSVTQRRAIRDWPLLVVRLLLLALLVVVLTRPSGTELPAWSPWQWVTINASRAPTPCRSSAASISATMSSRAALASNKIVRPPWRRSTRLMVLGLG